MQGKESRCYTIEDYDKVINLKKMGLSQYKIKESTGISTATIWHWSNTNRKPRFLYAKNKQKKISDKAKRLSSNLAYIYGVLIGDGHLEQSKLVNRINLNVTDKDFAMAFAKTLKNWCGFVSTINKRKINHNYHKTKYGNWIKSKKDQYVVRLCSKQIVEFLSSKVNSKTYTWKIPKDILNTKDKRFIANFLKGIFDSEGSAVYDIKNNNRRVELRMYGKEVKNLMKLLSKISIKSTVIQSRQDRAVGTYTLRILDKKSLNVFAKNINFIIKRKNLVLKEILKSYKREPYDGNKTEAIILSSLENKPKSIIGVIKDTNLKYNIINYHLKNLNGSKVEVVGKEDTGNVWKLK